MNKTTPNRKYKIVELFSGAGGLALGLEYAGLECVLLNDNDKHCCATLRKNRPNWNVVESNIQNLDLTDYHNKIDVITGGFPCQSFSYAGNRLGLNDIRGTLFYEFARIVKDVQPLICIAENVKGLTTHDNGKTLNTMLMVLNEIGYDVKQPQVLNAINYNVPQKRERIFLVGIRKDINIEYEYPIPNDVVYTVRDALKSGKLYKYGVPHSNGLTYSDNKKRIMELIPENGYWKDLPIETQKEYMGKSFYSAGGKTGIAKRLGWDYPSLTLTCSPAQKQTERCHPEETRPLTIREYARIQTFPDDWKFVGSISQQYKQIGNAVPVNLAKEIGYSIIKFLNKFHEKI